MSEVRIWVHPKFKKKLKKEAVEREMSIIELTERLAEDVDSIIERKKGGKRFGFGF